MTEVIKEKDKNETAILIRKIDRQLKDLFKIWCIRNNTTMTQEVIKLMRDKTRRI